MEREVLSRAPRYVIDNNRGLLWCNNCQTNVGPMVRINLRVKNTNQFSHEIKRMGITTRTRTTIDEEAEWLCGQCFSDVFPNINHSTLKNFKDLKEEK